jgi:hypothetical protein
MFDPYHKWLAIPPGPRPPTYYQLLGVAPDESDPEVIAEAALRQTSHVRTYQAGPHGELAVQLLNEIARARATLLDPSRRHSYDATLSPRAADQPAPAMPPAAVEGMWQTLAREEADGRRRPTARLTPRTVFYLMLYVLLLFVGGAAAFWLALPR